MYDVVIAGKKVRLDPSKMLGQGGEAEIFPHGPSQVIKLFKRPDHVDFQAQPTAQKAVQARLLEHQRKLPAFPKTVPARVVSPEALVYDKQGEVAGYTMRLLGNAEVLFRYTQRTFRQGIPTDNVLAILRDLHTTVQEVHNAKITIGDFNDLNIMVAGTEANIIDADSMQFGTFRCPVFTQRFVDPLLCDPNANSPFLIKSHNEASDWYAFDTMVFQLLLFTEPFGGVYKPKDLSKACKHDARKLHGITVFHPEVKYPKPAIPYGMLSDELLHHFHAVFERNERGEFPKKLLQSLRWTKCTTCGIEHARKSCPSCTAAAPAAVTSHVEVRGNDKATRIFRTKGVILRADIVNGAIGWLVHEGSEFRREDTTKLLDGNIDPLIRYRLQGKNTYLAKGNVLVKLWASSNTSVDTVGSTPVFDTNSTGVFWVSGDVLYRLGGYGPERIGDVLGGQTLIWVGEKFGFGFYRAGNVVKHFTFGTTSGLLDDSVKAHAVRGKLVDATCILSSTHAWFLTATQENGKTVNRCSIIKADGSLEGTSEAEAGDGSWLSNIRGCCATGNVLLVPTDTGVVQVKADGSGGITVVKSFPDTEPFVDAGMKLLAGKLGLYAISRQEITLLNIS